MSTSTALAQLSTDPQPSPIEQRRTKLAQPDAQKVPIWEPPPPQESIPTSDQASQKGVPELNASVVGAVQDIVMRPLRSGEGHKDGNDNKERELRHVFALLTPIEALTLRRRVAANRENDPLASVFMRLTADRRVRLLAFLADPRRAVR